MRICSICGSDKNVQHHHLSYKTEIYPEIVILACRKCEHVMHNSVGLNFQQFNAIFQLVQMYGDRWENGAEKHMKSEHCKNQQKKYQKTDKCKDYQKEYYLKNHDKRLDYQKEYQKKYRKTDKVKEYRRTDKHKDYQREYKFKNLPPDKMAERMENMVAWRYHDY